MYDGGAPLADDARIGLERTAVPVELDRIFSSLNDLNVALGPEGANKNGALSRLLAGAETGAVRLSVELCAAYWHFLLLVWLVLFALISYT